jgi:cytosine/adenosine deaminase-related metal-dependent hydrolase
MRKYPNANIQYLGNKSVVMPGLINSHIHLEFSANSTTLSYGNFIQWLFSVIKHRDNLIQEATKNLIDTKLKQMIQSGTTTIGAISSYGFDMNSCIDTALNVVYFTEALGSKPDMIDTLFLDFKEKLTQATKYKKENFIPAVAIHSPYSTHPFLIREVLKIAKKNDMAVSTHFAESVAENDWLNYSKGEFQPFFKDILNQNISLTKPYEFLSQFQDIKNLSFTHCVQANKQELKQIKDMKGTIIHCANSNRLLTNSSLNLEYTQDIQLALGTDGLSSNYTLNMFEELRSAFFIHTNIHTNILAKKLLLSATKGGAVALGLNNKGVLEIGKDSDIIYFDLPNEVEKDNLATSIILHVNTVKKTYIKGKNEIS